MPEYTVARARLDETVAELEARGELVESIQVIFDPMLPNPLPIDLFRNKRLKMGDITGGYRIKTVSA